MSSYKLDGLNQLAWNIYQWSVSQGFYETDQRFDGQLMNVVTEVAEAQEEWRNGRRMTEDYWSVIKTADHGLLEYLRERDGVLQVLQSIGGAYDTWADVTPAIVAQEEWLVRALKPEGIPSELADIIIRVLDMCAAYGINIEAAIAAKMAFNETRPYRNGGKLS